MRSSSIIMFLGLKLMLLSIFFTLFVKDGYYSHAMALYGGPTRNKNNNSISEWLHLNAIEKQCAKLFEEAKNKLLPTLFKNIKFKAFDRILGRF